MKRTILLLFVAVLSVATMNAQETKKASYVIDGRQIENFDGSQLQGKTILNYTIEPEGNLHFIVTSDSMPSSGKIVKKVFVSPKIKKMKLADSTKVKEFLDADSILQKYPKAYRDSIENRIISGKLTTIKSTKEKFGKSDYVVHVLDGKIASNSEIVGLSQSKIASMEIIKDKQSAEYKKYAKEAGREPKCIIKITTK